MQRQQQRQQQHPLQQYHLLVAYTFTLLSVGLMAVTSASSTVAYNLDGNSYSIVMRQIMFGAAGVGLMFWIGSRPAASMRRWANLLMVLVVVLLMVAQFYGVAVHGQRNWIEIAGPFRLQPSEFAKLAVVVWGAHLLARRYHELEVRDRLLYPLAPVYAVVLALVVVGGDVGTALILLPIMMAMLYFVGAPRQWFSTAIVLGLVGLAALVVVAPYRSTRIRAWLNQGVDTAGMNYQLEHGKIALGTGGWTGLGPGASRQKWGTLPEAHTDFIYAVIGEELGLVGTVMVLVLFVLIVAVAVSIARRSNDRFVQLSSLGIAAWFATQSTINVGAVLGVLPITGVPLPLVSYGGSSLIPSLAAMGMLMSFSKGP